jgi:predicted transglutaminase-like cysteine proteinase
MLQPVQTDLPVAWKDLMYQIHEQVNSEHLPSTALHYEDQPWFQLLATEQTSNCAVRKYAALVDRGFPPSSLTLASVVVDSRHKHGVLVICNQYVLDNSFPVPVTKRVFHTLFGYHSIRIHDEQGQWTDWTLTPLDH